MVGPVIGIETRLAVSADIARHQDAVGLDRDQLVVLFLAVHVYHQAADIAQHGGDAVTAGQPVANTAGADIPGNVLFQNLGRDTQFEAWWHAIGGMVAHGDDAARSRFADMTEDRLAHRKNPFICHQSE